MVTNGQGEVVGRRDNLPFGDALRDVNEAGGGSLTMSSAVESSSSATTSGLWAWSNTIRVQYAMMEKDVATGLDHTPFRKYDSGWGRWTTPDPYPGSMSPADPQSFNRYSYTQNDPVNFVDPSGLARKVCFYTDDGEKVCVEPIVITAVVIRMRPDAVGLPSRLLRASVRRGIWRKSHANEPRYKRLHFFY